MYSIHNLYILPGFYIGTANAQWVDIYGLENITFGSGLGGFSIGISSVILHPIAGNSEILLLILPPDREAHPTPKI